WSVPCRQNPRSDTARAGCGRAKAASTAHSVLKGPQESRSRRTGVSAVGAVYAACTYQMFKPLIALYWRFLEPERAVSIGSPRLQIEVSGTGQRLQRCQVAKRGAV